MTHNGDRALRSAGEGAVRVPKASLTSEAGRLLGSDPSASGSGWAKRSVPICLPAGRSPFPTWRERRSSDSGRGEGCTHPNRGARSAGVSPARPDHREKVGLYGLNGGDGHAALCPSCHTGTSTTTAAVSEPAMGRKTSPACAASPSASSIPCSSATRAFPEDAPTVSRHPLVFDYLRMTDNTCRPTAA
jgi:hypothetical protein